MSDADNQCSVEGCDEYPRAAGFCWGHAVPELSKFPTNKLLAMLLVSVEAGRAASTSDYQNRLLERIAHRVDGR